jgi:hypothetical protein
VAYELNDVPEPVKIKVLAGSSFSASLDLEYPEGTAWDLTGATVQTDILPAYGQATPVLTSFTSAEIQGSSILIALSPSDIASLPSRSSYRVLLLLNGDTIPVLRGEIQVVT